MIYIYYIATIFTYILHTSLITLIAKLHEDGSFRPYPDHIATIIAYSTDQWRSAAASANIPQYASNMSVYAYQCISNILNCPPPPATFPAASADPPIRRERHTLLVQHGARGARARTKPRRNFFEPSSAPPQTARCGRPPACGEMGEHQDRSFELPSFELAARDAGPDLDGRGGGAHRAAA